MVVTLTRKNITQQWPGDLRLLAGHRVRRWNPIRPAIGAALAGCVPAPD
jgi:hypothetical protein